MDYRTAIMNIRQYNKEYSKDDELIDSVIEVINYITEDINYASNKDIVLWAKQAKKDLLQND